MIEDVSHALVMGAGDRAAPRREGERTERVIDPESIPPRAEARELTRIPVSLFSRIRPALALWSDELVGMTERCTVLVHVMKPGIEVSDEKTAERRQHGRARKSTSRGAPQIAGGKQNAVSSSVPKDAWMHRCSYPVSVLVDERCSNGTLRSELDTRRPTLGVAHGTSRAQRSISLPRLPDVVDRRSK